MKGRDVLDDTREDAGTVVPGAVGDLRRHVHSVPAHPNGLDVVSQLVDHRAGEMGRRCQFREGLERSAVLGVARLHAQIHRLHHTDPDDPRLPDRAPRRDQHALAEIYARGGIRSGGDRA